MGVGFAKKKQTAIENGTKVGMILGGTALAYSILRRPQHTPKSFALIRSMIPHTLPTLGAWAGAKIGEHAYQSALMDMENRIPLSPAHILKLGFDQDYLEYTDFDLSEDIQAMVEASAISGVASLALSTISAARWVNRLSTPVKVTGWFLVVSVAFEVGLHYSEKRIYDQKFDELSDQLIRTRDDFLFSDDVEKKYELAETMIRHAQNLASFLHRDINEARQRFYDGLGEIETGEERSPDVAANALNELAEQLAEEIEEAAENLVIQDSDYEEYLALEQMNEGRLEDLSLELRSVARDRCRYHQETFETLLLPLLEERYQEEGLPFLDWDRKFHFDEYLSQQQRALDRKLSKEFKTQPPDERANHLLLQVASFLRTQGYDFLFTQVDQMMNSIDVLVEVRRLR